MTAFEQCFDMSSDMIIFPVRHHSPACSLQLERAAKLYRPDCILIEGPSDADGLISYLCSEGITPPVCIYSSYDDKNKDGKKFRAYYPFLDYSPELTAMRIALKMNISVHFIDMPFALQTVMFSEESVTDFCRESEDYYRLTAEKSRCRCFSEFWEKGFELTSSEDTTEFARSVFMLGEYMRELSPADEKTLTREAYMRKSIAAYKKAHKKIMVVCGAYHAPVLRDKGKSVKFSSYSKTDSALYLMPYSFAETDSRSGYSAGLLFPAYYTEVWNNIKSGDNEPYLSAALNYIVRTSRSVRKTQPVSLPDEKGAFYMAQGLAALRGKSAPGAFELIDGVRSAFVKGPAESGSVELDALFRAMTGTGTGKVDLPENADIKIVPPCVDNFRAECRRHRLNINTVVPQSTVLDIIKNKKHYEKSAFLHRLEFMETGFCTVEKGPDFSSGTNTALVREHWSYRYSAGVDAKLIDLSVFGGTVEAICLALLYEKLGKLHTADKAGALLLKGYMMGLSDKVDLGYSRLSDIIGEDMELTSHYRFLLAINRLLTLQRLGSGQYSKNILSLLRLSYNTAVTAFSLIISRDDENDDSAAEALRLMYSLSADHPEECSRELLIAALDEASRQPDISPQLYGVSMALLFKNKSISSEEYRTYFENYLLSANPTAAARFLSGIILTGRDVILTDRRMLISIDSVIRRTDDAAFMEILPHLRQTFTAFTPAETARIASSAAELYGTESSIFEGSLIFSAREIAAAAALDRKSAEMMKEWGIYD